MSGECKNCIQISRKSQLDSSDLGGYQELPPAISEEDVTADMVVVDHGRKQFWRTTPDNAKFIESLISNHKRK